MTESEETEAALSHAEGIADEQATAPTVATALERVERKVEQTLASANNSSSGPLTRLQTWVLTFILVGLQIATLVTFYFGISSRADDHRTFARNQAVLMQRQEFICLRILELLPAARQTPSSVAQCQEAP